MMKTAEHPARKYLNLREKNLAFFNQNYPGIYEYFTNYKMQHAKVDILPEQGEIDLIINGKHLYSGHSAQYAKKEVATFLTGVDYGSKLKSIAPLNQNTYKNKRFFSQSLAALYKKYFSFNQEFNGYELGTTFPLIVFMGIGLGKHIDVLCKTRSINHAVIFEDNMDNFASSLYAVDWSEIIVPFLSDNTKSLSFVLIESTATETQKFGALWNRLVSLCPIFPLTSLYYNHLGNPAFDRLSDLINQKIYTHLLSFGNLDDELIQFNNVKHNLLNDKPVWNSLGVKKIKTSVCIVGSGPSLDNRITDIKAIQQDTLIISCGTALRSLWVHGIKPDIQVELESDYNTFLSQSLTEDKAFTRSIKLVAAAQLNPLMFEMFGESCIFFKGDGPFGYWFQSYSSPIVNATPTCTNAALAIALAIQCNEVYLFGMDFGFPQAENHHATGSIYFKDELSGNSIISEDELFDVPAADGNSIKTSAFLSAAKSRIENQLVANKHSSIFNCSDGASIAGTMWLEKGKVLENKTISMINKQIAIESIFFSASSRILEKDIRHVFKKIVTDLSEQIDDFAQIVKKTPASSKSEFTDLCSILIRKLGAMEISSTGEYFFFRGAIWHFLLAGYSHVYSLPKNLIQDYISFWLETFRLMLNKANSQLNEILDKKDNYESDPMVNHSIRDQLVGELAWFGSGYQVSPSQELEKAV